MSHKIVIEGGASFDVAADEDSLLRGALRAGLGFPYDCGVGGCGGCRYELLDGEVEELWPQAPGLSDRERRRGRRLACQTRPLSDCRIKLRCDDAFRPKIATRRLKAMLTERREIAPDVAEFGFRTEAAAEFLPGQYAIFHPPGIDEPRAFSMANLPNSEGDWRFVIRRTAQGRGSAAMFDALPVGATITLDAPYGSAFLRAEPLKIICVGGGSGIGPVVSIARAALAQGLETRLFEGARRKIDLCAPALLSAPEREASGYAPVLSAEPEDSDWRGLRGFVHQALEQALGNEKNCAFYFAGPPPMIDAMIDLLALRWKIPHERIHFDKFF